MLTQAQVLKAVEEGKVSGCLDGRDFKRLIAFFPVSDCVKFGFELIKDAKSPESENWIEDWTEANIKKALAKDLEFAFKKALNKRGLSAGFMHAVIKMWLWILEDPLQDMKEYTQYGLPLFKAVALKYGLENPIGEDFGDEFRYSADS